MLERVKDVPRQVTALKAIGKLTKEDYERVFVPLLDGARREGRRLRLLFELGPDFDGFAPSGLWADAKLGLRSLHAFEACAVVTDVPWIIDSTRLVGFFLPCPVSVFHDQDRERAIAWLSSFPQQVGVKHRLIVDKGVIVIEVRGPLHAQDFEAVALTADAWIESHGKLQGIVVHTHFFTGWEDIGSMVRHMQFVRDHHRKVARIALAADTRLASLLPVLAAHFVDAEGKGFEYDQLESAIEWASGAR